MPSQQPLNHQNLFLLTEYNPPVPGVESDTDSVFETLSDDDGIDEHEMLSDDNDVACGVVASAETHPASESDRILTTQLEKLFPDFGVNAVTLWHLGRWGKCVFCP